MFHVKRPHLFFHRVSSLELSPQVPRPWILRVYRGSRARHVEIRALQKSGTLQWVSRVLFLPFPKPFNIVVTWAADNNNSLGRVCPHQNTKVLQNETDTCSSWVWITSTCDSMGGVGGDYKTTSSDTKTSWFNILQWNPDFSIEPPRETKIGSRNREFEISEVKLRWNKSKGNDFWFELSGCLRNWGFKKSGFHCTILISSQQISKMLNCWLACTVNISVDIGLFKSLSDCGGTKKINAWKLAKMNKRQEWVLPGVLSCPRLLFFDCKSPRLSFVLHSLERATLRIQPPSLASRL